MYSIKRISHIGIINHIMIDAEKKACFPAKCFLN